MERLSTAAWKNSGRKRFRGDVACWRRILHTLRLLHSLSATVLPHVMREGAFFRLPRREENSSPLGMFLAYFCMRRDLPPRLLEPHLKEIPYGYADSFPQ